jgi:hypothetical protein
VEEYRGDSPDDGEDNEAQKSDLPQTHIPQHAR